MEEGVEGRKRRRETRRYGDEVTKEAKFIHAIP